MNLIIPNLYLGSLLSGFNTNYLKSKGIKSVLQVCPSLEDSPGILEGGVRRWIISVADVPQTALYQYFQYSCNWIQYQLRSGNPVLVHCMAGISRSATLIIAYLMWAYGWTFEQARQYVRQRRMIINPNRGFVMQLLYWEKALQEQRKLRMKR